MVHESNANMKEVMKEIQTRAIVRDQIRSESQASNMKYYGINTNLSKLRQVQDQELS